MDMPDSQMAAFKWVQEGQYAAGALVKAKGYEPTDKGTVVYFVCDNLNNELDRVEANGGNQSGIYYFKVKYTFSFLGHRL